MRVIKFLIGSINSYSSFSYGLKPKFIKNVSINISIVTLLILQNNLSKFAYKIKILLNLD